MKLLAGILAVILAVLLAVCFILPESEPVVRADVDTESSGQAETIFTQMPTPSETTGTYPQQEPEDIAFVCISDYIPQIRLELAYATVDNFTGKRIYEFTDAYLRYGTVKKLATAAEILLQEGYGLVIWDGYRPIYAQERLWEICPDPTYVSKPGTGSQSHCRGIAVDITLYDIATGALLEMPSGFDDFSDHADRDYSDCSAEAAKNALLLENTMELCGFKPYSAEWWHFSDTDSYPVEYEFDPAKGN